MRINSRFISFGYDSKEKTFFMKTTDSEYLKVLLIEDPLPNEIIFELPKDSISQMCKFFSLWKKNEIDKLVEKTD